MVRPDMEKWGQTLVDLRSLSVEAEHARSRERLSKSSWGNLVGDRGYLSQALFEQLFAQGLQLITPIRKNMRNRLVLLQDKLLTRKRFIIETIIDQLKNISQIEHTRLRSTTNFLVNLIAGHFVSQFETGAAV